MRTAAATPEIAGRPPGCRPRNRQTSRFAAITTAVFVGAALVLGSSRTALAHPAHTTQAQVEFNPDSGHLECALRVRGSELERALSLRHHDSVDLESTDGVDELICEYLKATFIAGAPDGEPRPIVWVGKEVLLVETWLYFEVDLAGEFDGIEIANLIFMDLEQDQLNTIDLRYGTFRMSIACTRRAPSGRVRLPKNAEGGAPGNDAANDNADRDPYQRSLAILAEVARHAKSSVARTLAEVEIAALSTQLARLGIARRRLLRACSREKTARRARSSLASDSKTRDDAVRLQLAIVATGARYTAALREDLAAVELLACASHDQAPTTHGLMKREQTRLIRGLRQRLGDDCFDAMWRRGCALTLDVACDRVTSVTRRPNTKTGDSATEPQPEQTEAGDGG